MPGAKPAVVHIVGKSGAGKTRLMTRLVRELRRRGYAVGTVKHASHGFDPDRRGKDSWRHFAAGSRTTVVVSPRRMALVRRTSREMGLEEAVALAGEGVDIVLVEGYRSHPGQHIEVHRQSLGPGLLSDGQNLLAVVSDGQPQVSAPLLRPDQVSAVADLIEREVLGRAPRRKDTPCGLKSAASAKLPVSTGRGESTVLRGRPSAPSLRLQHFVHPDHGGHGGGQAYGATAMVSHSQKVRYPGSESAGVRKGWLH